MSKKSACPWYSSGLIDILIKLIDKSYNLNSGDDSEVISIVLSKMLFE
jgi:hypothetical protein